MIRQKVLADALNRPEPSEAMNAAATDVLAERCRQIEAEGWTPEHDDTHSKGEMVDAAACYCMAANGYRHDGDDNGDPPAYWPWPHHWWKPSDHRRNLVKAGALILAEIERLDRAAIAAMGGEA